MAATEKSRRPLYHLVGLLLFLAMVPGLADEKKTTYEFRGKVVRADDGKPIKGSVPVVFLRSVTSPFTTNTLVGPSGKFRFKDLAPSPYRMTIAVPNWGQMERSIDIGPSFADEKNRIEMEFEFTPDYQTQETDVVNLKQLTVSKKAVREFQEALKDLEKKQTDRAIDHLEKAVEISPHYSDAWNRLGTISFVSNEFSLAEQYFRNALKHDPNSFSPVVNLGAALYAQGKVEESLVYNQKAADINPKDPLANSQLGLSFLALKKYAKAEDHLLKCKSLDPAHFSHPQLTLAELYRRTNNTEGMAREIKEFIYYHPDDIKVPELKKLLSDIEKSLHPE